MKLYSILLNIEPKGEFSKIIHWGIRNNHYNEVVSMIKDQSKVAPEEVREIIGNEGFRIIKNVA